jgi:aldehyde dehydrogenase (NAD(P)+)
MSLSIPQTAALAPTPNVELDAALETLTKHKQAWVDLRIEAKTALLRQLIQNTGKVAERWVNAALAAKRIPTDSPYAGEEWSSGPWAVMYGAARYAETLEGIARAGTPPLPSGAAHTRRDGQVVVDVFPQSIIDTLILNGVTGQIWMQPGVTEENLTQNMAGWYREQHKIGHVALVLGAGNIASIGPLDVLWKLIGEGQVCLLKMNPVNEYLGPLLAEAFHPFIEQGFLRIAYGGVSVGEYLTQHPLVEEIHVTGSARTHDAIVFGSGPESVTRKQANRPLNVRRVTSELGNVSPIIVVPGPWTAADLRYQAENIATMKMHNAGFNCIAGQVLVLPKDWSSTDPLVAEIKKVFGEVPNRASYYPGADARQKTAVTTHPNSLELDLPREGFTPRTLVSTVDPTNGQDNAFQEEAFCSALSQTRLPGADAASFLANAVRFCNDTLWGTLGANVLIHPETERQLGEKFDDAIAELRYGCIAINSWTGVGFLLTQLSWGAFPGHLTNDIRSGVGTVHNSFLFDRPQKSVVRQNFYPMVRGLLHGAFTLLPKPPWFITNKTAALTSRRLVEFSAKPGVLKLMGIFSSALRG